MKPRYRDRRRAPGSWVPSATVVERAGITYRQLDHWCKKGYVRPDEGSPGTGRARSFAASEAEVIVLMGDLVSQGMTPELANRVARDLVESGSADVGPLTLSLAGGAA